MGENCPSNAVCNKGWLCTRCVQVRSCNRFSRMYSPTCASRFRFSSVVDSLENAQVQGEHQDKSMGQTCPHNTREVPRAFPSKCLQSSSGRTPIRSGSTQQSPDIPRPARRLGPRSALQLIFKSFVMSSAVRLHRSVPDVSTKRYRSSIFKSSAAPLPRSIRLHKETGVYTPDRSSSRS